VSISAEGPRKRPVEEKAQEVTELIKHMPAAVFGKLGPSIVGHTERGINRAGNFSYGEGVHRRAIHKKSRPARAFRRYHQKTESDGDRRGSSIRIDILGATDRGHRLPTSDHDAGAD